MPPIILKRAYWEVLSRVERRNVWVHGSAMASFTFDDFPKSALVNGGSVLKEHGARGTYYAAMGLMDSSSVLGKHFDAHDLDRLLQDGHELGGHTYSHVSCKQALPPVYRDEVTRGQEAVLKVTGSKKPPNFSYPFGDVRIGAKKTAAAVSSSCRTSRPGVNSGQVDRNLLRANSLPMGFAGIEELITRTLQCEGWLIFYTHDVCPAPSPFGCTPEYLERVLRLVMRAGLNVVPVGAALSSYLDKRQA